MANQDDTITNEMAIRLFCEAIAIGLNAATLEWAKLEDVERAMWRRAARFVLKQEKPEKVERARVVAAKYAEGVDTVFYSDGTVWYSTAEGWRRGITIPHPDWVQEGI